MATNTNNNYSTNLTQEHIDAIKNYKDEIQTMKSFVDAVKKRPGMYIGHLGNKGFINMFREAYQNAVEQLIRPDSPCTGIWCSFDEVACAVAVEDNGLGLPFGEIERIMTKQNTSSSYNKKPFQYGISTHGIGMKVVNALSDKLIVESYIFGEARHVEFNNGVMWEKGERSVPNKQNKQGTMVLFQPDLKTMGNITAVAEDLLGLIEAIMPLTAIGSKTHLRKIAVDGSVKEYVVENKEGLMTYIKHTVKNPMLPKCIEYGADTGIMRAHIMMTYEASEDSTPIVIAFSNMCPTDNIQSSHAVGFYKGLRKFFVQYMNKVFLATASNANKKKKSLTVTESDIRCGLRAVLDVSHLNPNFTGQAKEILSSEDMEAFMDELTYTSMDKWAKENPAPLQKLCKFFKEMAEIRTSGDEKRIKLTNQFSTSLTGLPSKYCAPTKKVGKLEFIVAEGDSAAGSMKTHRINELQGILGLRGKIPNCLYKKESELLSNPEIAGMIAIIGGGYGKNFDISKVKWDKFISMMDADAHGQHQHALILRFVLRFMPQMILAGKFYRSVPPLYTTQEGKRTIFFTNKWELVQYIQTKFSKNNSITYVNDKPLSSKEVSTLLYNNIDYIYEVNKIANRYRVDPLLLELYLNNKKESVKKICDIIHKQYRFMDMVNIKGHIVSDGILNGKSNTLFIGDKLLSDCSVIMSIMDTTACPYYKVNGETVSLYKLMQIYDKSFPATLNRLKGLGEQDAEELFNSCVDPNGNRTLIQYTMSSAMKEIQEIRELDSNMSLIIKDLHVTRTDVSE